MASIFFSYSHADEALRDQLEKQLALLKRQGVIETWHDRRISAGSELNSEIDEHINSDDIILLLVSPDFLDSDYCYDREMTRALERHDKGEAVVLPVILRPCDWHDAPFGKLLATPTDGRPVTKFADRDDAMLEVTRSIRTVAEKINSKQKQASKPAVEPADHALTPRIGPRSSNLALAKNFTQKDRESFQYNAFEYMARYFEASLEELSNRNPGIETTFRRIDANRFSAIVYKDGTSVARATIFIGGERTFANGIAYSDGDSGGMNSFNELLTAEADDETIYFRSMGMSYRVPRERHDKKLTMEGASELYWSMLISPLQSHR